MLGDARLFTDQLTDVPLSIFFPHGVSATASGIDFLRAHFSFLTEQMFFSNSNPRTLLRSVRHSMGRFRGRVAHPPFARSSTRRRPGFR